MRIPLEDIKKLADNKVNIEYSHDDILDVYFDIGGFTFTGQFSADIEGVYAIKPHCSLYELFQRLKESQPASDPETD